jgi:hypothetical protein
MVAAAVCGLVMAARQSGAAEAALDLTYSNARVEMSAMMATTVWSPTRV